MTEELENTTTDKVPFVRPPTAQEVILEQDKVFYDMLLGFRRTLCTLDIQHPIHGKWKLSLNGDHFHPPDVPDQPTDEPQVPPEDIQRSVHTNVVHSPADTPPSSLTLSQMDDLEQSRAIKKGHENNWEDV